MGLLNGGQSNSNVDLNSLIKGLSSSSSQPSQNNQLTDLLSGYLNKGTN